MKRFTHLTMILAVAVLAVTMSASSTRALTIVPPTLDYSLKPGDVKEGKVKLYNESTTEAITVFGTTSNFTAKDETGEPDFDLAAVPTGAATWVETVKGPITIQPNERIEIPFTLTVPKDAEPGGHYVSLFFGTDPSLKPQEGGQVTVRSLLGALIIMRVDGLVRESAAVASFTVKGGKTLTHLPVTFNLRVQNSGNVHVRPQGTILIKNLFGGETTTLSINDANGAVLPNSIRLFDATWKKDNDSKAKSGFFGELSSQWSNFAFGPYTATATLNYGTTSKQTLVASTKVTIIPWQLLTLELIVLIIIIMIIVLGLKAYNKTIIRKAQQTPPLKKG